MKNTSHACGEALSPQRIHLILLPTERCNFRCRYCYEDFRLSRMPPEVVQGVQRLLEARAPDLRRLELSWFGGEPLVALDVVHEIMTHVQQLTTGNPALRVTSDMTTNGDLLTREIAEGLLQLGVGRYQITLDGVQADHDAIRQRANGTGTFERVWRNLVALKRQRSPLSVLVRIHVTSENAHRLPELLASCADEFAHDPRFAFFIRPLSQLGGANDASLPVLDAVDGRRTIERLRRQATGLGLTPAPPAGPICYAARANSWVVRANGDLGKCTVALSDPRNRVGRLNPDGTLVLDPGQLSPWLMGLATGRPEELECPWKALKAARLADHLTKTAA